jgi:quercetin dioxygenase-like cupin family protein
MSLAKSTSLIGLGDIRGTIHDFEKAGDVVEKHAHTEVNVHITIVARGKLKAYSHDWEQEATAGQILDFKPGQPHELMALEDNTRIINILKKHTEFSSPVPSFQTDVTHI